MSNITLNDIREAMLDEKIIIKHNGIDVFMECQETNEKLIIPMAHATVDNRNSRVERMFGARETWNTASAPNPDEGQGPYKGFLLVVCEECGEIKAFCAKRETYSFRCDKCGHETALENLRPMYNCLRGTESDGMPRGSSPGKPTETLGLRAMEHGVGDRLNEIRGKERLLLADEARIRDCLDGLNGRYKQVIVLRYPR